MTNFQKDFKEDLKDIKIYYDYLVSLTTDQKTIGVINEWIIDNYAMLLESSNVVSDFLTDKTLKKTINNSGVKLRKMIENILEYQDYKLTEKTFIRSFHQYQKEKDISLSYHEIQVLKPLLIMELMQKIRELCEKEQENLETILSVDREISRLEEKHEKDKTAIVSAFVFDKEMEIDPIYFDRLNYHLTRLGTPFNDLFYQMNEVLEANNLSLRQVIRTAQADRIKTNLYISKLFNLIKVAQEFKIENLYQGMSITEKELNKDSIYRKMDEPSKDQYRNELIKKAKHKHLKELAYARQLIAKGTKEDKHIGFYLFPQKSNRKKVVIYLTTIFVLTFFLTGLLSFYLTDFYILNFILLLIPTSEIVIQLIEQFLMHFNPPRTLPALAYKEGIPTSSSTILVIPTILKDPKKVEAMFLDLEKYYLSNKSNNLYFALLGDCTEQKEPSIKMDKEIKECGLKCCARLNKKYGKELFYFAYRKRVYHESEDSYLGWERKRGAIIQFNELLLKKMTKAEKNSWFEVETLSNLTVPIRYVVTVDAGNVPVLGSIIDLVRTMDHPLVRPVMDKNKTKVIKGHALIEPKLTIDIESSNRSFYAELFAGLGGFDVYNTKVANFYQDIFDEGSFMGKGIYDLEVFDTLLSKKFPKQTVLSHDLIEGNYLRSGFASNIEIVDDFSTTFLRDMTRHHRWARGDVQMLPWVLPKVKDENGKKRKNPTTLLGKWKILDNIRRNLIDVCLLLILIAALLTPSASIFAWSFYVALIIFLPLILYLNSKIHFQFSKKVKVKPYHRIIEGTSAVICRSFIQLITLPYQAWLYLNAMGKAMYRLVISKKHLLSWMTAEEAERTVSNNLINYLIQFWMHSLVIIILIVATYFLDPSKMIHTAILSILFLLAPFILWAISQPKKDKKYLLDEDEQQEMRSLGKKTWAFFEENLTPETNFLIPDNFQENREIKKDHKTSSTDIGFSLTSVVSAYELGYIKKEKALYFIENILKTIESLPKWYGHLYNWYDINKKTIMPPSFVSSVDSGNFTACLFVTKAFLKKIGEEDLAKKVANLIDATDFSKLYTQEDVFSIGYNVIENEASDYHYNRFASESRLLSYVAIAKGDVPAKHWFCLDKTLTKFQNRKGLASWAGSLFEYYMPLIFMKNYKNTLLDESYDFAYFCQRYYMDEIDSHLPWGISECAYDELDNGINYKYRTFSVPYLRLQGLSSDHIVISPYSSMMVLPLKPKEVFRNYKKWKKLGMLAKYGFYESYDTKTKRPVYAYFSHHQGMILASIANYLEEGVIQDLFAQDERTNAFEILTKEKIQLHPVIDLQIAKYKRFHYEKEKQVSDMRYFTYLSDLPEVSVVSNGKYTVLMNDRGNGFSRYKEIQINRYRKVTEQDYGTFLYIKDLATNEVWSNTFAPINEEPDQYEVVFASDKIKYVLSRNDITTTTEVIVTDATPVEIRKITLKNNSHKERHLELTSYLEPTMTENSNDVTHRTFHSLFFDVSYDEKMEALLLKKINRDQAPSYYLLHKLMVFDKTEPYTYETRRENFIGRNRTSRNPLALENALTNSIGTPIDPVLSMQNTITLHPNEQKTIIILNSFGTSSKQVIDNAHSYDTLEKIEDAIASSSLANRNQTKKLGLTSIDMELFNQMLNYLYQTSKISISEERQVLLRQNTLGQPGLWKFGISGDRPLITVTIHDVAYIGVAKQVLKAYEYFKSKGIYIDVAIINDEKKPLRTQIQNEIEFTEFYIDKLNDFSNRSGHIYLIDKDEVTDSERILLNTFARLRLDTNEYTSLKDYIKDLQEKNHISSYQPLELQENEELEVPNNLTFYNQFGGFLHQGKEYVVTNPDTPTPWINVLANKNFGTLVSNNMMGFTYYKNSQEFKLTSWTNDIVAFDPSEGFKVNGFLFHPTSAIHSFGYSSFRSRTNLFEEEVTMFVPRLEHLKIYLFTIKNRTEENQTVDLSFFVNPVLGDKEEKTSRYILCNQVKDKNYLTMRNVYQTDYQNTLVFMSSNEPVSKFSTHHILVKSLSNHFTLAKGEEKTIVYILGTALSEPEISTLMQKYETPLKAKRELKDVINYFQHLLDTIQVKTPDVSFDYMLNGWYLYQTIVGRIRARSGFYQVSGAFGYRDQLQDNTNIASILPERAKEQILKNAYHQFPEGDALHWWLEPRNFGLRSRYKDDYLWLVYAVSQYVRYTKDKSILSISVPFIEGDALQENEEEKGITFTESKEIASVYEHCRRAIDRTLNDLGSHGLPKIGGGDWNDGMNKVGIKGYGESVWLSFFYYDLLNRFIELSKLYQKDMDTSVYEEAKINLSQNIERYAYDKDYYLRAYFDNGDKLGSSENEECQIDLISQCFAILSGVAPKEKYETLLTSIKKNLVDPEIKIVKLLTPPFSNSPNYPGYIQDYPKGIRENGGQYTHAVAWYVLALIKAGHLDEAYEIYQQMNPIERTKTAKDVSIYKTEPYVIVADIYANREHLGRGGWTWYTGSAGWFYKVGIEDILGFHKKGEVIEIKPMVPSTWKSYEITYRYMDTKYHIKLKRSETSRIIVDGQEVKEIKLVNDLQTHEVEVEWR